jgi:hypothetical protein
MPAWGKRKKLSVGLFTIPTTIQPERIGHHWIDLARGYLLHGDKKKAFASLSEARRLVPTRTRYHSMVHETIRVVVRLPPCRKLPNLVDETTLGALSFPDFRVVLVTVSSGSHRTARSYLSGRSSFRIVGRSATSLASGPCGPATTRAPQPTSCVIPSPFTSLPDYPDRLARQAVALCAVVVATRSRLPQPLRQ